MITYIIVCLLFASNCLGDSARQTLLRHGLPSVTGKDTSIQYTDEPDPAIYAAGQASAAAIAYGSEVLLKGSPSSKNHGGVTPSGLETPAIDTEKSADDATVTRDISKIVAPTFPADVPAEVPSEQIPLADATDLTQDVVHVDGGGSNGADGGSSGYGEESTEAVLASEDKTMTDSSAENTEEMPDGGNSITGGA